MSEQEQTDLDIRTLPHQHLLNKYDLDKSELDGDTKQLLTELNRVVNLCVTASRGGDPNVTDKTLNKIKAYDKSICNGIFEYLALKEEKDKSEEEATKQAYMKSQKEGATEETPAPEKETETTEQSNVGFWKW